MNIKIIQGDITKLTCDAIVNAANKSLLGGGGVDGAIHSTAGPKLLEECRGLGGCHTGEAKITAGYDLPAKYVIHTAGPVYSGKEKDAELLASCYRNSLDLGKKNLLKSIAFCAISTGVYGYPIKEATEIALTTVAEWLKQNPDYDLEIIFCCHSKRDAAIYVNTALAMQLVPREENIWVPSIAFAHENRRLMHCKPMSLSCVEQRVHFKLEPEIMKNLLESHVSCAMEDHWDLLYEAGKLYCYRSWTGFCLFVVDVTENGHISHMLVCQDRNQYTASLDAAVKTCQDIVCNYFQHDQSYYDD